MRAATIELLPDCATPDGWRAGALVDGVEVWFESSDARLTGGPEAFGSAFLVAALAAGRPLELRGPGDPRWLSGTASVLEIAAEFWGLPRLPPHARPGPAEPPASTRATGLCFSGGVDSFHALRFGSEPVDVLVAAVGFDIALTDAVRSASYEEDVRAVAAATRTRAIVVRTNLRDHPLHRAANWEWTHGGALAGLGHLLRDELGELLVAASYPYTLDRPWGSHWRLDPQWSSSCLEVRHIGAERWRADKLADLAGDPLALEHLRVCWRQPGEPVNCGRCEKCLRTRLVLARHGVLDASPRFASTDRLAAEIDALEAVGADHALVFARELRHGDLPPDVLAALERLVDRCPR